MDIKKNSNSENAASISSSTSSASSPQLSEVAETNNLTSSAVSSASVAKATGTAPLTESFLNDVWGGLAAMLVALPSSVAFGILVYSGFGVSYSAQGAMAGLLGAAVLGLVTPFIGKTTGLISAPCAPSAAVLSALVMALTLQSPIHPSAESLTPQSIIVIMVLASIFSATLQILFGALGGGKLIKFIPFQVVSGYLSGVGLLIMMSQIPKLLGLPKGVSLWSGLVSPDLWKWQGLVVGLITIVVMVCAPYVTKKIPAAIFGLVSGVVAYFGLGYFSNELLTLNSNPLIIGSLQTQGGFLENIVSQLSFFKHVDFELVKLALVPSLTLATLLSIDTLKTCVGLDALTRKRHNSDRELIGQGIGNLISAFVGGLPGAGTMGPTLVNVTSGGRTPRAGMLEGVFVLLALLFLGPLIAWVPIGSLAGILLVVAFRMIDKTSVRLLKHASGRFDFAVIIGVVIVAMSVDLIAASGFGVALSILLFIRDQIRDSVILQKSYLNQKASMTHRQESEREILQKYGNQAVICNLQGNLFFGTTDQLYTKLEEDLRTKLFILLDMRRVRSIDYTAVHMLEQIQAQLSEKGGQLLFSGMPSGLFEKRDFEKYLAQMGLVNPTNGVKVFQTLDSALEWMEEEILKRNGVLHTQSEVLLELKDFNLFRGFTPKEIKSLENCMTEVQLNPGDKVFKQGDLGDEIYLVRRGSFRALLPLAGGKYHHVATFEQGSFFGEIAFLDHNRRSTDVEAKTMSYLFVLSRAKFNQQSLAEPEIGAQVYARLALAIAQRLRMTDLELRNLEER